MGARKPAILGHALELRFRCYPQSGIVFSLQE
jgi:hypothetical protein